MKKLLFLIAIVAICFHGNAEAENVKIHAVVFCATDDEKIGEGCKSDQERLAEELGIIGTALKCEEDWHFFVGKDCNKSNLELALSGLQCNSNDVVFFYYSGHGVHAKADPANGWLPQMCLNHEWFEQDKFVPVTYVREKLSTKGARLVVILTDCCNDEANWVSVKSIIASQEKEANTDDIDVNRLKKLFYESRGTVIATSSKRGQMSYGPKEGGCFSNAFWNEMWRVEHGEAKADWNSLINSTKERTLEYTANKQEPAFEVNVSETICNTQPNPLPVVISVGDRELGESFKQIINSSFSRTERLNMVSGIVQRFFEANAQVFMVGRNITTAIGRPTAISKYLEELALSKRVKGINIVRTRKGDSGKFNQIVISEIR